jgi:hypothetical protein
MRGKMRDRPTLHALPDLRERMEVAPPVELDLKKRREGRHRSTCHKGGASRCRTRRRVSVWKIVLTLTSKKL